MKLTNEIARKNIGSYIDVEKRVFGYYPKKIIESTSGELLLKDPQGVCTPIEDSGFNSTEYDFILKEVSP